VGRCAAIGDFRGHSATEILDLFSKADMRMMIKGPIARLERNLIGNLPQPPDQIML
jgi:hypothetical protein